MRKSIFVYADWKELGSPELMGTLYAEPSKGKEVFSFEYSQEWLNADFRQKVDPDLHLYPRVQYLQGKTNFGCFKDASPDRWGETLIKRREFISARKEGRKEKTLLPSDFLIGVYDEYRMGALRFKLDDQGAFLNDDKEMASPPFTSLRELEHASLEFQKDNMDDPKYVKWVNLLFRNSLLGGARPKASVIDPIENLWIAKFPSLDDDDNKTDIGAWEMVTNELAKLSGINVADGMVKKFSSKGHTFLSKRFDRVSKFERIHFASAMTLLEYSDGQEGASYLDIANFITAHGENANGDLEELWRRIVFNICVKNIDDHLRNHGFLLAKKGWLLSPAYDMNPVSYGTGLSLNINEGDNSLDLDLALSVCEYFRLTQDEAILIMDRVRDSVSQWRDVANKYNIPKYEQERMSKAFLTK